MATIRARCKSCGTKWHLTPELNHCPKRCIQKIKKELLSMDIVNGLTSKWYRDNKSNFNDVGSVSQDAVYSFLTWAIENKIIDKDNLEKNFEIIISAIPEKEHESKI